MMLISINDAAHSHSLPKLFIATISSTSMGRHSLWEMLSSTSGFVKCCVYQTQASGLHFPHHRRTVAQSSVVVITVIVKDYGCGVYVCVSYNYRRGFGIASIGTFSSERTWWAIDQAPGAASSALWSATTVVPVWWWPAACRIRVQCSISEWVTPVMNDFSQHRSISEGVNSLPQCDMLLCRVCLRGSKLW